jgi:SAF domain
MTTARVQPLDAARPGPAPAPAREAAVRRRRRPGLWAAGAALLAVGALSAAALVGRAGDRVAVVAVARTVHIGQTISDADLAVARVAADPALQPIPGGDRGRVVGMVAAVELRPGSLLTTDEVTHTVVPAAGEQLVGLPVKPGQLPARGLVPGDRVLVVATPGDQTAGAAAAGSEAGPGPVGSPLSARVVQAGPADADGTATVDVVVPERLGPVLAAWGSTGRIVLVLLPAGG